VVANPRRQIDAVRFDIGTHRAWRDAFESERRSMLLDLLAFNQTDLSPTWLARGLADAREIPRVSDDPLVNDNLNAINLSERLPGLAWMQMEGGNVPDRFRGIRSFHD
jgi:hypothetical protein